MKLAIIDYKAGNVRSVDFALQRLGVEATLSSDKETLLAADKIIFPGVGHAQAAMEQLEAEGLDTLIPNLKQPVLGICLGMQLLCKSTEEGNTEGLGVFDTEVKHFIAPKTDVSLKIPHMGWNNTQDLKGDLFKSDFFINHSNPQFYFVHSYYAEVCSQTVATCDYILSFSAALQKDNFYAAQFHPEKSAGSGEELLRNFLNL